MRTENTCDLFIWFRFIFWRNISWKMLKIAFPRLWISKFSGRACPQTPLEARAFGARFCQHHLKNSNFWLPPLQITLRRPCFVRRNTIIELTYRAVKRSVMRIIVLPVGRCRFLEENESGLRFPRNKIWRFTECTTPYNRPSFNCLNSKIYCH